MTHTQGRETSQIVTSRKIRDKEGNLVFYIIMFQEFVTHFGDLELRTQ